MVIAASLGLVGVAAFGATTVGALDRGSQDVGDVPEPVGLASPTSDPHIRPADPIRKASVPCEGVDADGQAAAERVRQAMEWQQDMNVPTKTSVERAFDESDAAALQKAGDAAIAQLFTGDEAVYEQTLLQRSLTNVSDDPNFRALGGGVSEFVCLSVKADGDVTVVSASLVGWSKMAELDADGVPEYAQPTGTLLVDATLTKDEKTGKQAISHLKWDFAPGSGP